MSADKLKKSQRDRFKEAAHELEASQDEERFKDALRQIGQAKPPDKDKTKDDDQKPGQ
ncbi:MAG: hypothetical protein AAF661_09260 [Pseudomonadota bacterium]